MWTREVYSPSCHCRFLLQKSMSLYSKETHNNSVQDFNTTKVSRVACVCTHYGRIMSRPTKKATALFENTHKHNDLQDTAWIRRSPYRQQQTARKEKKKKKNRRKRKREINNSAWSPCTSKQMDLALHFHLDESIMAVNLNPKHHLFSFFFFVRKGG